MGITVLKSKAGIICIVCVYAKSSTAVSAMFGMPSNLEYFYLLYNKDFVCLFVVWFCFFHGA